MRKALAFGIVLLLAASAGFSGTLTFKLYGGLNSFVSNELTSGFQGQTDYLVQQYAATGAFEMPKSGAWLGGEIAYFPFSKYPFDHFGIGVGYGYTRIEKTGTMTYAVGQVAVSETMTPTIQVKPLTFNLHWLITVASWLRLDIAGGLGSYDTTLKFAYENTNTLDAFKGSEDYSFQFQKSKLGFQYGIGIDILISSHITVSLNGWARSLKLDPITSGTWTDESKDIYGSRSANGSDHAIWAYDWTQDGATYPQLAFQTAAPTGTTNISNVRQPRIDLSGLTATLGLKIGFNI